MKRPFHLAWFPARLRPQELALTGPAANSPMDDAGSGRRTGPTMERACLLPYYRIRRCALYLSRYAQYLSQVRQHPKLDPAVLVPYSASYRHLGIVPTLSVSNIRPTLVGAWSTHSTMSPKAEWVELWLAATTAPSKLAEQTLPSR